MCVCDVIPVYFLPPILNMMGEERGEERFVHTDSAEGNRPKNHHDAFLKNITSVSKEKKSDESSINTYL